MEFLSRRLRLVAKGAEGLGVLILLNVFNTPCVDIFFLLHGTRFLAANVIDIDMTCHRQHKKKKQIGSCALLVLGFYGKLNIVQAKPPVMHVGLYFSVRLVGLYFSVKKAYMMKSNSTYFGIVSLS